MYWDRNYLRYALIRIQGTRIEQSLSMIKDTWDSLLPQFPFDYKFLDDKFDEQYKSDMSFGRLVGVFSSIAIFIACIGILGLSYFYLNQQVKNIGIRKVHGATTALITRILTSDIVKRVVVAYIIAILLLLHVLLMLGLAPVCLQAMRDQNDIFQ